MRVGRSTFCIAAICTALALLVFWLGKKPTDTATSTTAESASVPRDSRPPAAAAPSRRTDTPTSTKAPITTARSIAPAPTPPLKTKAEQMQEGLATLNDEDVLLYGSVIDQFGAPVPGATVAGSIQVNNGTRIGTDRISVATDSNGMFTISGYKGKSLGIWVTKEGYVMATTKTSFVYSLLWPETERHNPDPNSPVVIRMWKLEGAEPLVGVNQHFKLPYTSAPICVDLLRGEIVTGGGDFRISLFRPEGIISQQHPQNWSLRLEVIDGGFIPTSAQESRVTYSAPESRYQERGDFPNNNGPDLVDEVFFIKSRGGQIYSKLQFTLRINNTPDGLMSLTLSGVANTNNSRNWEATAPK